MSESALKVLNSQDAYNFEGAYDLLGPMAALPENVAKLYTIHEEALFNHLPCESAQYAFGLYAACRKHLLLGAVSLLRLYSAQMFRETRAAVEAAGIAHAIQTDAESFRVFKADDGNSEAARKEAQKRLTSRLLFPTAVPRLAALKRYYGHGSDLSHTNWLTLVRHLRETKTPGVLGFTYQDIKQERLPRDLPKFLLWLCVAHVQILLASEVIFSNVTADLGSFERERKYVFDKVGRFVAQNRAQFPPEVAFE